MNVDAFVAERQVAWTELDAIVTRAKRRPHRLDSASVHRLGELYRATVADLAFARRRWPGDPVVARLEQLVLRARPAVYTGAGTSGRISDFVRRGYWRSVAERPLMLLLAATFLFGAVALTAVWAWRDPEHATGFVPSQYRVVAEPHHYDRPSAPTDAGTDTSLAAQIMTNNIRVTFMAFGGGLLLGVGAAFVLIQNGALLGALWGLAIGGGNGRPFLELIAPHGVLELSCIVVAAAAGLRVGWAVVAPGYRRRSDAVRDEARAAVPMIIGTACWLVVAGLVEGFVTPRRIGVEAAVALGVALAAIYWTLVFVLGRPRRDGGELAPALAVPRDQSLAESFSLR
jgi:uncharacterized membrane protein SpoIIM required for sporulation